MMLESNRSVIDSVHCKRDPEITAYLDDMDTLKEPSSATEDKTGNWRCG
jgi:hypothetical protein